MAFDEGLAERIRTVIADRPGIAEKKMFGGLAFMLNDHMLCGVREETLMARVGPDNHAESLAQPHAREMDFTGRSMKGFVYVDPAGLESDDDLKVWVDRCADFVLTLPPKQRR